MPRELKFFQAIREATDLSLASDPAVFLIGLGVPDPKGIFGTTYGLHATYGPGRVMDMPASENAMTGVVIGAALVGMRPIITHQRVDFALVAMEQMVNQAANWHYMFGGKTRLPIVIRMIVGRGWGQGPQHSQSLHALFAHVPGLKVVMPATPSDAKGLLISAVRDDNPVIFLEHRWLHNISGEVPEGPFSIEIGKSRVVTRGDDITVVASSYMTLESLRAAHALQSDGVSAEVVDLRTLKPLDRDTILDSVAKTGRLLAVDAGWYTAGFAAEILATVVENAFDRLRCAPVRISLPDCPCPTSPALASFYYPRAVHIIETARRMMGLPPGGPSLEESRHIPLDVPDPGFTGPF